jgi:hypothetical protein
LLSTLAMRTCGRGASAGAGVEAESAGAGGEGSAPDRTTVGLSGAVSVTSGGLLRSADTTTVTLSRERWRVPSGAIASSTTSCAPGGSGGGTNANNPDASATTRACGRPLLSRSIVAPGTLRPAITASPLGSTRTTSKDGAGASAAVRPGSCGVAGLAGAGLGAEGAISGGAGTAGAVAARGTVGGAAGKASARSLPTSAFDPTSAVAAGGVRGASDACRCGLTMPSQMPNAASASKPATARAAAPRPATITPRTPIAMPAFELS